MSTPNLLLLVGHGSTWTSLGTSLRLSAGFLLSPVQGATGCLPAQRTKVFPEISHMSGLHFVCASSHHPVRTLRYRVRQELRLRLTNEGQRNSQRRQAAPPEPLDGWRQCLIRAAPTGLYPVLRSKGPEVGPPVLRFCLSFSGSWLRSILSAQFPLLSHGIIMI